MTEAEWLAGDDPLVMLDFVGPGASVRKLRLFALWCWQEQWNSGYSPGWREAGERYAEGVIGGRELHSVLKWGIPAAVWVGEAMAPQQLSPMLKWGIPPSGWTGDPLSVTRTVAHEAGLDSMGLEEEQCRRVRDIFGNPFRPVAVDPQWLTSTVQAIARGIYDEYRDHSIDVLVLSDALRDAGCEVEDVHSHLLGKRSAWPWYMRGDWVLDLLLGKA